MATTVQPVILCGGAGSRLWPLSTQALPKQFHALTAEKTLFQVTLERVRGGLVAGLAFLPPIIIANHAHGERIAQELADAGIAPEAVLLEPEARNTGPALAAVTAHALRTRPDGLLLALPADHHIADVAAFHEAIVIGAKAAAGGAIVTFGIIPDRPETGYGYIHAPHAAPGQAVAVRAFVEKPDRETAESYLAGGEHFWNAGIFLFRADRMADAFRAHAPAMLDAATAALDKAHHGADGVLLDPAQFAAAPATSIDYAIMEHATNRQVVPVTMGWSDVGSYTQLLEIAARDAAGNGLAGDVIAVDCTGSYVRTDLGTLGTIGLRDMIVVREGDAVLVAPIARAQEVKAIVERVRSRPQSAPISPLQAEAQALRDWLFNEALPLWAERGFDFAHGGAFESLDARGQPDRDATRRTRVLARQIYSFALARQMGWQPADAGLVNRLLAHGLDGLTNDAWSSDGGFVHRLGPDNQPVDHTRDTYDQAFCLLAFATLYRATRWADAKTWLNRTLGFIDARLADPKHGGVIEGLAADGTPLPGPRRANPHMHLLEALLAAHEATGEVGYLTRASKIVDLFTARFFDPTHWVLHEYFHDDLTVDWARANGISPGHHYEWGWLLLRYQTASGIETLGYARKLVGFAEAFGRNHATGTLYDATDVHGQPTETTSRLWPLTEAIKGLCALSGHGAMGLEPRIVQTAATLRTRYLSPPTKGAWVDQLDASGRLISNGAPASSFYHIICAVDVLGRAANGGH